MKASKLSEAIRAGSKKSKQARGKFFTGPVIELYDTIGWLLNETINKAMSHADRECATATAVNLSKFIPGGLTEKAKKVIFDVVAVRMKDGDEEDE